MFPPSSLPASPTRGSSIAKIIGHNVKGSNRFDPMVNMWVYEEEVDGRKLTEIINTDHENVKYLPGHKLPRNVVRAAVCRYRGKVTAGHETLIRERVLQERTA